MKINKHSTLALVEYSISAVFSCIIKKHEEMTNDKLRMHIDEDER